nr:glycine betaine ABC transporter substrate-binding protein [Sulfobacillus harzensis]
MTAVIAGCGSSTGGSSTSSSASAKTITIGYIDWPEDVAASNLWDQILTKKGYHVKLVNASVAPVFVGVGQGTLNLFMDAWLPHTQGSYWNRIKANAIKINSWYTSPTKEGFVVPDYVNISTTSQLKSHASEFNNQIIGIDPGAGEMGLAQKAIKSYGLPEQLVSSSDSGMLAALSKAESQHKPIVVTLWSPHWAFAKWHLKYLSDPKNIFGPADHIYTIANKSFPSQHPTVDKWLKNFHMNQAQLGQLENDINAVPSSQINSAVNKWISQNQSLVNSWTK